MNLRRIPSTTHRWRALVVLLILLIPTSGLSQENGTLKVSFQGTEAFRNLMDRMQLVPIKTERLFQTVYEPKDCVVIVFGDLSAADWIFPQGGIRKFCSQGGAVLLASNRWDKSVLRPFRLKIPSAKVKGIKEFGYRNIADCPMITSYIGTKHPIFSALSKGLATNRPTFVRSYRSDLLLLAGFNPGSIRVGGVVNGPLDQRDNALNIRRLMVFGKPNQYGYIFGSGADSKERIVVMGGYGVFLNGMMAQWRETDNAYFAYNCLNWLTEREDGQRRSKVLFVEEGKIHQSFDVPLTPLPPVKVPKPTVEVINMGLDRLQKNDVFNQLLFRAVGERRLERLVLQGLVISMSVLLLLWGLRKFWRSRLDRNQKQALAMLGGNAKIEVEPIFRERFQALGRQRNLGQETRQLLREWFTGHGISWEDEAPLPQLLANSWNRWKWAPQVQTWWRLARASKPTKIAPGEFRRMIRQLRKLNQLLSKNVIRFQT